MVELRHQVEEAMNIDIRYQELVGIVILVQYGEFVVGDTEVTDDCTQYHVIIETLGWIDEEPIFAYSLDILASSVRVDCAYFLED